MTLAQIRERIYRVLHEHFAVRMRSISDDVQLIGAETAESATLGLDSLDMVELRMAAEEDFNIEIADDEHFFTPGELAALVAKKLDVTE